MLITFGNLAKKSLLFLAVPISSIIRLLLTNLAKKEINKDIFFHPFLKFTGRSLHFILVIILECMILSNKKKNENNKDALLIIPDQNDANMLSNSIPKRNNSVYSLYESDYNQKRKIEKKNKLIKISLLILVCILDFLFVTTSEIVINTRNYSKLTSGVISSTIAIRIFAIGILSKLIIKNAKMYRHHYLSIIIIFIVVIIINIFSLSIIKENNKDYFKILGLMNSPELFCSIMYVVGEKYLSLTNGNI